MASLPTSQPQQPQGNPSANQTTARRASWNTVFPHHFPLGYQSCTIDELRGFVKDRTGYVADGRELMKSLIERLLQADRDWRFDFFGLPIELRGLVFGHLLHLHIKHSDTTAPAPLPNRPPLPTLLPPAGYQPPSLAHPPPLNSMPPPTLLPFAGYQHPIIPPMYSPAPLNLPPQPDLLPVRTRTLGWPTICHAGPDFRKEAEDVLYGENNLEINISQRQGWPSPRRNDPVRVTIEQFYSSNERLTSLVSAPATALPDWLLRLKHLTINLKLINTSTTGTPLQTLPTHMFLDVHYHLYYTCSFLADSKSLKMVAINVDGANYPKFDEHAEHLLWPIVKLPSTASTTLKGVPGDIVVRLLEERRQDTSGNRVHRLQRIFQYRLQLHKAIDKLGSSSNLLGGGVKKDVAEAVGTLRNVLKMGAYVDHISDAWFMRCAESFEAKDMGPTIDAVKRELKNKVKKLEESLGEL
ncbi:hypothetical protein LTR09_001243 [Extremus antarcticus]|uniref:Uncharacterized protein n=1 Tax=Extremus antarcticus TaxID=702011 RepID=A0AAJ0GIK0_9PEZI|nr:hypothetical protein LTR09_001243 [Extremus antarcticus]